MWQLNEVLTPTMDGLYTKWKLAAQREHFRSSVECESAWRAPVIMLDPPLAWVTAETLDVSTKLIFANQGVVVIIY